MIKYRLLHRAEMDRPSVPFGVAFQDTRGVFLFVPQWRGLKQLHVADLRDLNEEHIPNTVFRLSWARNIESWEGNSDREFNPADVLWKRPEADQAVG